MIEYAENLLNSHKKTEMRKDHIPTDNTSDSNNENINNNNNNNNDKDNNNTDDTMAVPNSAADYYAYDDDNINNL